MELFRPRHHGISEKESFPWWIISMYWERTGEDERKEEEKECEQIKNRADKRQGGEKAAERKGTAERVPLLKDPGTVSHYQSLLHMKQEWNPRQMCTCAKGVLKHHLWHKFHRRLLLISSTTKQLDLFMLLVLQPQLFIRFIHPLFLAIHLK